MISTYSSTCSRFHSKICCDYSFSDLQGPKVQGATAVIWAGIWARVQGVIALDHRLLNDTKLTVSLHCRPCVCWSVWHSTPIPGLKMMRCQGRVPQKKGCGMEQVSPSLHHMGNDGEDSFLSNWMLIFPFRPVKVIWMDLGFLFFL